MPGLLTPEEMDKAMEFARQEAAKRRAAASFGRGLSGAADLISGVNGDMSNYDAADATADAPVKAEVDRQAKVRQYVMDTLGIQKDEAAAKMSGEKFAWEKQHAGDTMAETRERERLNREAEMDRLTAKELSESERARLDREAANYRARVLANAKPSGYDNRLEQDINDASKRLEALPSIKNNIDVLVKAATQDDIPGIGPMAGRMPDILTTNAGIQVRQAARGVIAALIKEQSGTAASEQEVQRKLLQYGMQDGAQESAFRNGIQRLLQDVRDTARTKEAAAKPEALAIGRSRGLITSQDLPQYEPPPAPEETVMVIPPGGSEPIPVHKSKVDAAVKAGGRLVESAPVAQHPMRYQPIDARRK